MAGTLVLEVVQLLGDLLARFAHVELLGLEHRGVELLEPERSRDVPEVPEEPVADAHLLRREIARSLGRLQVDLLHLLTRVALLVVREDGGGGPPALAFAAATTANRRWVPPASRGGVGDGRRRGARDEAAADERSKGRGRRTHHRDGSTWRPTSHRGGRLRGFARGPEGSGCFALARVRCVTSQRKVSGFTRFFQHTRKPLSRKVVRERIPAMQPFGKSGKKSVAKIFDVDCQAAKKDWRCHDRVSHAANPRSQLFRSGAITLRRRPSRRESHRRHLVDEPFTLPRALGIDALPH